MTSSIIYKLCLQALPHGTRYLALQPRQIAVQALGAVHIVNVPSKVHGFEYSTYLACACSVALHDASPYTILQRQAASFASNFEPASDEDNIV